MKRSYFAIIVLSIFAITACGLFNVTGTTPVPSPSKTPAFGLTPLPTLVPSVAPVKDFPTPVGALPWNTSCNIGASSGNCQHSSIGDQGRGTILVQKAMEQVFNEYRFFFEEKGTWACKYRLKRQYQDAYYYNLILRINQLEPDVCAQFDGEHINLKYVNSFSVSYHPIRYDGAFPPAPCLSDKDGIYMFTCTPAGF
jgi:hypothetical protein